MSRVSRQWFDQFVANSHGELIGYLIRMLRSPDDALEVSQEAYLKVFLALRKHQDRDHCPKALLYTAARNLAISRLRHQQIVDRSLLAVTVSQELQSERRSPEQTASKHQDLRALLRVVNQLPPKCRKVLMLRMGQDLSQKEIAEHLGIAVRTVEKHLAKALHSCRDRLKKQAQSNLDAPATQVRAPWVAP